MPGHPDTFAGVAGHPAARLVRREWRRLAGGTGTRDPDRRTLIACSGGCDSSAMALALSPARRSLVLAHVVHDLRPPEESLADRDGARALAERLGIPFVEGRAEVRGGHGNLEAMARAARYRCLAGLARGAYCPYIAVAHQGDDLLETLLMRLVRGAGPMGLSGLAPIRKMGGRTLIRPMLGLTRQDAVDICRGAGWVWREDATNADTSRLRSAVRYRVLPLLHEAAPGLAGRARTTGELLADAAALVAERAARVVAGAGRAPGGLAIDREHLSGERAIVVGEVLRLAARQVAGSQGLDGMTARALTPVVACIRGTVHHGRAFTLRGVRVEVTGRAVRVTVAG
jgi:tRNA(Ile)-lysidine synthase